MDGNKDAMKEGIEGIENKKLTDCGIDIILTY